MTRRYFAPELPTEGGVVTLENAEAHHALHVMRIQVGDAVELFDGKGNQSRAVVQRIERSECHCSVEPAEKVDREPRRTVNLGIALPKADRARELVERLTELGVKSITPLIASRTQRPPSQSLVAKLHRGVIEACKQSGRNELLQILPIEKATDFFAAEHAGARLIAHLTDDTSAREIATPSETVTVAVGPEGGWTEEEVRVAVQHQFQTIDLGKRIYRIETAATVLASLLTTEPI